MRYEIGPFQNDAETDAAQDLFIHVYVEREGRKATPLPQEMRSALEKNLVG